MKILVLSITDPWGVKHGGTIRTRSILNGLSELGHNVTCIFPGTKNEAKYEGHVKTISVATVPLGEKAWPAWLKNIKRKYIPIPTSIGGYSNALANAIEREGHHSDVFIVSTLWNIAYWRYVPQAKLWVDHSDLLSAFALTEASIRRGLSRISSIIQAEILKYREIRVTNDAVVSTAAGMSDYYRLKTYTENNVFWLPTPLSIPSDGNKNIHKYMPPKALNNITVGMLGNFHFGPNRDAYNVLVDKWVESIKKLGWNIIVGGHDSENLDRVDGVDLLGRLDSLDDFYSNINFTVAPIRIGGGMKVKVLESLAYGRPVIGSHFAFEGFPEEIYSFVQKVQLESPDFTKTLELLDIGSKTDELEKFLNKFTNSQNVARLKNVIKKIQRN